MHQNYSVGGEPKAKDMNKRNQHVAIFGLALAI